jgi:hypothetical protein
VRSGRPRPSPLPISLRSRTPDLEAAAKNQVLQKQLVAAGYDPARLKARIAAVRAEVYAQPVVKSAASDTSEPEVTDRIAARLKKAPGA